MALLTDELTIAPLRTILNQPLTLPTYQRPYRWRKASANTLFLDTYHAFKHNLPEYRLGTVIFHKDDSGRYNIVDGQQRLTTLSILLHILGDEDLQLLEESYSEQSQPALVKNYRVLAQRVNELRDKAQYKAYLLRHCKMVQIVTDSEQEAFQFFDSQNTRGKALAPHDLLKSYHLREMNHESDQIKKEVIKQWEDEDTDDLKLLFSDYLYPVTQWTRLKRGLNYSSDDIDQFKGIAGDNTHPYALYHKASHLYVEQFNTSGHREILGSHALNQFQLTQPIVAGRRFFDYTLHYQMLLAQVKDHLTQFHDPADMPDQRAGDQYIKQLYTAVAFLFADRFGVKHLTDAVLRQLYTWSYSLRLSMYAVYPETIDRYARGKHERINTGVALFEEIRHMQTPDEMTFLILEKPELRGENETKYEASYKKIQQWNGW